MSCPPPPELPARLGSMFIGRRDRYYVAAKVRSDPLYDAVFRELGQSGLPLLDVGCGLGLLAFYLRERGFKPPVRSLDYDARKVAEASRIATEHRFPGLGFEHHDARAGLPEHAGNVTILDILQFFQPDELDPLLRAAAERVAPGGKLVIRSAMRDAASARGVSGAMVTTSVVMTSLTMSMPSRFCCATAPYPSERARAPRNMSR